ncbi:MAG TPA: retropepsin-like aspartic protease, partial [Desulfuromonadaceae bacterium]
MARPLTLLLILLLFCPLIGQADLFQYTDENGTIVVVDDEGKIPKRFRKQTRITRGAPQGAAGRTTGVTVRNNQVLVPVRFSYRNTTVDAWLLLDTGASTTMISGDLANRLGIRPANTQQQLSRVADGRVVQTFRTRVDYLAVGPKLKQGAEVAIMPTNGAHPGFDGLLGM